MDKPNLLNWPALYRVKVDEHGVVFLSLESRYCPHHHCLASKYPLLSLVICKDISRSDE